MSAHVRTRIDRLVEDAEAVASALDSASAIDPDRRSGILPEALIVADDRLAVGATWARATGVAEDPSCQG